MVDEFQDVNPLQKLLLEAWLGDRDDVCVVGDPRQTIYSFTGATPAYLTGFAAEFPGATVVRLVRNYRSTPQVVALANELSQARRGVEGLGGAPLAAQRPAGPRPGVHRVPGRAGRGRGRGPPRRHADLVGHPGQRDRGAGPDQRPDPGLRAGAGQRRGAVPGPRGRAVLRAARGTPGGHPAAGARRGRRPPDDEPAGQVRPVLAGLGPDRASRRWAGAPPASAGSRWRRWPSSPTTSSPAPRTPRLADLADELAVRSATGQVPVMEGITLGSLHAAKGLEWDVVFLPGLTDGHAADHLRPDRRGHRRGAAAAVRRRHPGPRAAVPVVGAGPVTRRPRRPGSHHDSCTACGAGMRSGSPVRFSAVRARGDPDGPMTMGAARPSPATDRRCGPIMSKALDDVVDLLDLEQIELDIFRGRSPAGERRQRVFGGQVAGQALVAAGRTVPEDRPVHSLHAYFIRPGDPAVPLVYLVERVRDGRSFTTRRVSVVQHGKTIFTLSASFHHGRAGRRARRADAGRAAAGSRSSRPPSATAGSSGTSSPTTSATAPSRSGTSARWPSRLSRTRRCAPAAAGSGCGPTATCPTTRCCTCA